MISALAEEEGGSGPYAPGSLRPERGGGRKGAGLGGIGGVPACISREQASEKDWK